MLRAMLRGSSWSTVAVSIITVSFLYIGNSFLSTRNNWSPGVLSRPVTQALEVGAGDNVLEFTKTIEGLKPDLLWLSLTSDSTSWGRDADGNRRNVTDFLDMVLSQRGAASTTLGILTSSTEEYLMYRDIIPLYNFARVVLIMHPGFHDGPVVDRKHRHDGEVQTERRAEVSKLRNYLMLRTLRNEQHVLWTDADVIKLDYRIVDRMVAHAEDRRDVGILTARCSIGNTANYDLNAWNGTRRGPRGWDLNEDEIANGELRFQGQHHVEDIIRGTSDNDLLPLQTVGATILYMRASLIWRGVSFPHQYVIGTRWNKGGWDGIESEGLCYRAQGLAGGKCFVLGGRWHVEHSVG